MNALRNIQHEFLDFLLDNSSTGIVARVKSTRDHPASQRMAIYGNAYRLRLLEVLNTDYDKLHAYLGDALFEQLAQQYIDRYPSHHASLRYFGKFMVELVESLEPFSQLPELAEIARIELAFSNSFDAADAACVTRQQLAQIEASAWAALKLEFQDAMQLLPQRYNSFEIWRALASEATPPDKTDSDTTWLVWRQDMVSRYRALDRAETAALITAGNGGSFADVCEILLDHIKENYIPMTAAGFLRRWVDEQLVTAVY